MRRLLTVTAAGAALAGQAGAQQAGAIDWSELGFGANQSIPSGTEVTSAGVTAAVTWRTDGTGIGQAPNLGQDYLNYQPGSLGGVDTFARLAFDASRQNRADRMLVFVGFNEVVTDVRFTLTDIDQFRSDNANGGFHDAVGVYVDRGNGFENLRNIAAAQVQTGTAVAEVNPATGFGSGWQGNTNVASADDFGNLAVDLGAIPVTRFVIVYNSGPGLNNANPGNQQVGLSDITFTSPPPPPGADLSLTKTVSDQFPAVGDQVTYAVTLSNAGPDAASVVVRDLLPSGVAYVSDDAGGAYTPGDGLWQVPGPVPSGATRTLSIVASVRQNGQRTNLAEVWTSDTPDADSSPGNSATDPFEDDTARVTIEPGGQPGTPGQPPPLSCAPNRLDWDQNPWPAGTLAQSYQAAGTDFAFAIDGGGAAFLDAGSGEQTPVTSQDFTGGRATPEDNVYIVVDQQERADTVRIGADVGIPGVGVSELQFTIFDVDYGSAQFEDRIAVAGYKGDDFVAPTLTPSSENRVDNGQALGTNGVGNTGGGANLTVTFKAPVDSLVITYGNGARAPSSPGQQAIGIDDFLFCQATGATLTAAKSVSVYDPLNEGLYMLPGVDARYAITVSNAGDGATDPNTVFLSDKLPTDVTFWSGDVDDAGPQTGPVGFSQSGAGLSFGANDVGFASTQSPPASFAACTYAPNGGYDPNVRHVCFRPSGAFQAGDPDPSFTVWFRARID